MMHELFMKEALQLARQGLFSTAPNPRVGCVLVKNGEIIGRGYHRYAGEPHAEVHALKEAGENAKDATAYVTLEPCAHYGRTPPCAEALIGAGVKEVFIACTDPNPLVAGKGIKMLNEAGIKTHVGICEKEALDLNRGFFKRIQTGRPFVMVKTATSLDGKSALANGQSQWITGTEARQDVHFQRLQADAILAGTGSVITDQALLTARYETHLPNKKPLRVVIDGKNQMTPNLRLFTDDSPVLIANLIENPHKALFPDFVTFKKYPEKNNFIHLEALLDDLGARGINYLFVEAGQGLTSAFLNQGLADEIILYLAPCFLGQDGRSAITTPLFTHLSDRMRFQILQTQPLGSDLKLILQPLK